MKAKLPERARENLALRFRQNWLARHPTDSISGPLDDSLTSLGWLQNLNILKTLNPTPPSSPDTPLAGSVCGGPSHTRVNPNHVLNIKQEPLGTSVLPPLSSLCSPRPTTHLRLTNGRLEITPMQACGGAGGRVDVAPPLLSSLSAADRIDYRTNHSVKPPFSYATLICMAMRESHKSKMTLAGIYSWITENFAFYRHADPSWQNSIRHNLSLNKCFQKVARRKDEPGKGGFWRINPEYSHMFVNGVFKKRRPGNGGFVTPPGVSPPAKRIKLEPADSDTEEGYLAAMAISNEMDAEYSGSWDSGFHRPHCSTQGTHNSVFSDHSDLVKSDFNWNAIFHQDIDVSGVRIKTEDIIDGGIMEEVVVGMESPITALSPPASPTDSSDPGLEDLLGSLPGDLDSPLDLSTGGELDLTITGTSLKAPNWWAESVRVGGIGGGPGSRSGLSTPVAPSPVPDPEDPHPWAEPKCLDHAMLDLDLPNLFDDDSFSGFSS